MPSAKDPLAGALENHRALVRLSAQYFLKTLDIAKAAHGGDAMQAIIFTTLWSANVNQVRSRGGYDETLVPDEERRPVTVARLAQLVGAPTETVRRHVVRLIEEGLCTRVGRKGVVVTSEVFLREATLAAVERQCAQTRQFHRNLSPLISK